MTKTYKTIFVSDVHLGSKDAKAGHLDNFLKHNTSETLYLVGDIIDGWKMKSNKWRWRQSHTNVVRRVLGFAKSGTKVVYVAGNHDEFLRPILHYGIGFGLIEICNQAEHIGIDGKRYLVIHGDLFDGITRMAPWIGFLGDHAYDVALAINNYLNWVRNLFGLPYWSISRFLKSKVKHAVDFIFEFEKNIVEYCRKRDFNGVICGHVHTPEIKTIDDTVYMNSGDWVESCTALVETHHGTWEIITWNKDEHKNNSHNH